MGKGLETGAIPVVRSAAQCETTRRAVLPPVTTAWAPQGRGPLVAGFGHRYHDMTRLPWPGRRWGWLEPNPANHDHPTTSGGRGTATDAGELQAMMRGLGQGSGQGFSCHRPPPASAGELASAWFRSGFDASFAYPEGPPDRWAEPVTKVRRRPPERPGDAGRTRALLTGTALVEEEVPEVVSSCS